jgi:segregation and condensation protein A
MSETEILDDLSNGAADSYILHINNYEGPLGVLWDLIKKSKIDITEISISHITEQYIEYLKMMEGMNVKIASEFIWMASELLYYKSLALLPTSEPDDELFVPPLPPELIQKLLEYKKFQQSSEIFKKMYELQTDIYVRENKYENHSNIEEDEVYSDVSLFDLLKAFARILESQTTVQIEEIVFDEILVSTKIEYVLDLLKDKEYIIFTELFSKMPKRPEIVASFLAVLEMTKTSMIKVRQHKVFGEIRILRSFSSELLPA